MVGVPIPLPTVLMGEWLVRLHTTLFFLLVDRIQGVDDNFLFSSQKLFTGVSFSRFLKNGLRTSHNHFMKV